MQSLPVYHVDWYRGLGRRGNPPAPGSRTALLLGSKYYDDLEARDEIISEMVICANMHRLSFDLVSYALAHDSGFQHARSLAADFAKSYGKELLAPSNFTRRDLTRRRILLIDDVCTSGKTLRELALRLLPDAPLAVYGLVYLKSHHSPGLPIA